LAQCLREASPKRLADDALSIIYQPLPVFKDVKPLSNQPERTRPLLIDLWESISGSTRIEVERLMQQVGTSRSCSAWLVSLADLLGQERLARKLGAPRSQLQLFVSRVAAIWRRLGLRPGLTYNFFLHPG